jgi:hypothetical protein
LTKNDGTMTKDNEMMPKIDGKPPLQNKYRVCMANSPGQSSILSRQSSI